MKLLALIAATALAAGPAHSEPAKVKILQSVKGFYKAFNAHDFSSVDKVTTPGWNHINPLGGRTIGRAAVLAELKEVHSTFLRGVTDTPLTMDVEMLAPTVALATVVSRASDFTTPDGHKHQNERQIRTFVVVKKQGHWLITRDHNTFVE